MFHIENQKLKLPASTWQSHMAGGSAQVRAGEEGQALCNPRAPTAPGGGGRHAFSAGTAVLPCTAHDNTVCALLAKEWMLGQALEDELATHVLSSWFLTVWWHCLWLKLVPEGHKSFPQLSPFQQLLSLFLIALPLLTDSTTLLNVSTGHLLIAELFNFPKFFLILNLRKNFTRIKTESRSQEG